MRIDADTSLAVPTDRVSPACGAWTRRGSGFVELIWPQCAKTITATSECHSHGSLTRIFLRERFCRCEGPSARVFDTARPPARALHSGVQRPDFRPRPKRGPRTALDTTVRAIRGEATVRLKPAHAWGLARSRLLELTPVPSRADPLSDQIQGEHRQDKGQTRHEHDVRAPLEAAVCGLGNHVSPGG